MASAVLDALRGKFAAAVLETSSDYGDDVAVIARGGGYVQQRERREFEAGRKKLKVVNQ